MTFLVAAAVAGSLGILGYASTLWLITVSRRYEEEYVKKAAGLLDSMHSGVPANLVLQGSLLTAALGGLIGFMLFGGWIAPGMMAFAGGLYPLGHLKILDHKRRRKFQEQLPDVISQVRTAVACGYTLPMALAIAQRQLPAPASHELRVLQGHLKLGLPLPDALARLQRRMPGEDLDLFVGAVTLAERSGGQLGKILNNIESTIRERLRLEKKLRTMTSRGRMEAWIITLCPVGLGAGMYALSPDLMGSFFTSPAGPPLLVVGGVFIFVSYIIMRRILQPEF